MAGVEAPTAGADTGPRSRLLPGARRTGSGEVVRASARAAEHGRLWTWLVLGATVAAGAAGCVVMALAVREAGDGRHGAWVGLLTWIGLGVALLPAVAVASARDTTVAARWTALATAAVATVVPVGLRAGDGPATTADLLQFLHLSSLRGGGPLFAAHLPTVVADQPGAGALATAVWRVSGLTVWHSALVVVVLAHLAAVLGVRALVRGFGLGERTAVLAAVLWAVGPAVLIATSRVSGTTVGVALLLWALASVVQAATAATPGRRYAWTGTAVGLAAATAVSDVVSAWTLVGLTLVLGLVTIGVSAPPTTGAAVRRAWWPAAAGVLLVTAAWSLCPPGRRVLGDLDALGAAHDRAWTTGPAEVAVAVAAVVVGLALAAAGVFRLRSRLHETGPLLGLVVAALFPVSLLGLLAAPTTTLAVALWPVLAAALAPFVAAGVLAVWDLGARRTRSAAPDRSVSGALRHVQRDTRAGEVRRAEVATDPGRPDRRVPLPVAATAALLAAAVVGFGASAATAPSAAGPVGESVTAGAVPTAEALTVADRLTALAGPGFRFVASDPRLGRLLVTVSGGVEVGTLDVGPSSEDAVRTLGADWIVDTTAGGDDDLALQPWLVRVLSAPSLTVYRVRPLVPGLPDRSTTTDVVPAGGS